MCPLFLLEKTIIICSFWERVLYITRVRKKRNLYRIGISISIISYLELMVHTQSHRLFGFTVFIRKNNKYLLFL